MLVEYIEFKKEKYAVVVRYNYENKPIDLFTDNDNEFQMGMFTKDTGYRVEPHKHICDPFKIQLVQEFILVKNGKLKMEFFSSEGKKYNETILNAGDSVLTMKGGHSIYS